jgi:hypothetical protein
MWRLVRPEQQASVSLAHACIVLTLRKLYWVVALVRALLAHQTVVLATPWAVASGCLQRPALLLVSRIHAMPAHCVQQQQYTCIVHPRVVVCVASVPVCCMRLAFWSP